MNAHTVATRAHMAAARVSDLMYGDGPWSHDHPDVIAVRDAVKDLADAVAALAEVVVGQLPSENNAARIVEGP